MVMKFSLKNATASSFILVSLLANYSFADDVKNLEPQIPTPVEQNGRFINQESYSYTAPSEGYSKGLQPTYTANAPKKATGDVYMDTMDKIGVSIGAGALVAPQYQGSKEYDFAVLPSLSMTYDDKIFASTRDGVGYHFIQNPDLTMTAALGYDGGRNESQSSKLKGMGNVDYTYTANLIGEYRVDAFSTNMALSVDPFNQGRGGYTVKLSEYYNMKFADKLTLAAGPSATWASNDYMQSYFGVDSTQSHNSGYKVFDASSGFKDVALNARMGYKLDDKATLYGNASYTHLLGDAADSPISDTDNNYFVGLGVDYKLY